VTVTSASKPLVVENAVWRYYDVVARALAALDGGRNGSGVGGFDPGSELPPRSEALERLFAASRLTLRQLGRYRGRRLSLLDLMGNPRTRTTKTFASLVIVARLVRHVLASGEPAMIATPTSGNKGTALRDAVLRAIESGLVDAGRIQVTTVVPPAARSKLWSSPLDTSPELCARNPVVTYAGAERADVKGLTQAAVEGCAGPLHEEAGVNLWYTMSLDNYRAGDVVRAAFERDVLPPGPGGRLHVHAVSSAFGLLGHSFGRTLLATSWSGTPPPARYFLVQHLETPDMVLDLHFGSTSRDNLPRYRQGAGSGLYRQDQDPRFPATTFAVDECLDTTFYTKRPATSGEMSELIRRDGGGGVVVSLHECLQRYAEIGRLLAEAGVALPADPRRLREWSLVMALTGILNAIDRGLVEDDDILVHGSGSYSDDDFEPIPAGTLRPVGDAAGLRDVIRGAVALP
jgi:uncharacterized protein DUF6002